ncbi:uncharacterized protein L969DRAFT_95956 [Mixia osmundae IAM 14324]|uniref:Mediator of RNA polymerase II transcription subunit 1 n=1 Tax=Mixia osmundae (strain CBS 9802 / IAM 14324 / JCM 22182 / KY 12970) TaxID=764103 RepID=G7DWX3_MIXOS|nr:uncharacterized protein L969DRAFT_95956 [Mixia osmundae IAM 14324]KEI38120.1 hypothetical protein L969DRAFT_95956 [Mixia osmundae IAM 14324]GAA95070.1 hypothetical protein E5Q_01725 [Mixia osmundae IAM 14324]
MDGRKDDLPLDPLTLYCDEQRQEPEGQDEPLTRVGQPYQGVVTRQINFISSYLALGDRNAKADMSRQSRTLTLLLAALSDSSLRVSLEQIKASASNQDAQPVAAKKADRVRLAASNAATFLQSHEADARLPRYLSLLHESATVTASTHKPKRSADQARYPILSAATCSQQDGLARTLHILEQLAAQEGLDTYKETQTSSHVADTITLAGKLVIVDIDVDVSGKIDKVRLTYGPDAKPDSKLSAVLYTPLSRLHLLPAERAGVEKDLQAWRAALQQIILLDHALHAGESLDLFDKLHELYSGLAGLPHDFSVIEDVLPGPLVIYRAKPMLAQPTEPHVADLLFSAERCTATISRASGRYRAYLRPPVWLADSDVQRLGQLIQLGQSKPCSMTEALIPQVKPEHRYAVKSDSAISLSFGISAALSIQGIMLSSFDFGTAEDLVFALTQLQASAKFNDILMSCFDPAATSLDAPLLTKVKLTLSDLMRASVLDKAHVELNVLVSPLRIVAILPAPDSTQLQVTTHSKTERIHTELDGLAALESDQPLCQTVLRETESLPLAVEMLYTRMSGRIPHDSQDLPTPMIIPATSPVVTGPMSSPSSTPKLRRRAVLRTPSPSPSQTGQTPSPSRKRRSPEVERSPARRSTRHTPDQRTPAPDLPRRSSARKASAEPSEPSSPPSSRRSSRVSPRPELMRVKSDEDEVGSAGGRRRKRSRQG